VSTSEQNVSENEVLESVQEFNYLVCNLSHADDKGAYKQQCKNVSIYKWNNGTNTKNQQKGILVGSL
jgi:hypothetical protein